MTDTALLPAFRPQRVDAHQHFWRYAPADYPWMGEAMGALKRDHLPQDLIPILERRGMDGTVAVQARASLEENEFLLSLAESHPQVLGVVGWLDFTDPGVAGELERLGDRPALKGYRHLVQDERDPSAFLAFGPFNAGIAALQKAGRLYELLVHSRDLAAAAKFCARHDRAPIVLCHLGKPDLQRETASEFAERLAPLARLPHVHCKISGLVTEARWGRWQAAELLPYLWAALELFGPGRALFGSDWPVCLCAAGIDEVYQLAEAAAAELSEGERDLFWGLNAVRLYNL
jgi:L-fuconolactonase